MRKSSVPRHYNLSAYAYTGTGRARTRPTTYARAVLELSQMARKKVDGSMAFASYQTSIDERRGYMLEG